MKKQVKKNSLIFFNMFILLAVLAVLPAEAAKNSEKRPVFPEKWDLYLTGNPDRDTSYLMFNYLPEDAKVVKVVSDKKSIANVYVYNTRDGEQDIGMDLKKTGTMNLKIRVKTDSRAYTLRSKITVRRHKNPFSSLKIGKKEVKGLFKRSEYIDVAVRKRNQRITVKPVKGWELDSMTYEYGKKTKELKNGGILHLKKNVGESMLNIEIKKTGTDQKRNLKVYFYVQGNQ